jgi:TolB protein
MVRKLLLGITGAVVVASAVLAGAHTASAAEYVYRCCYSASIDQPFVFTSTRTGHGEIWSQYADGSGLRQLTSTNSNDVQPSFNGSRSQVVFASDRLRPGFPGRYAIFVMNADGTNQHAVTGLSGNGLGDRMPSFNAAGTKIAFMSDRTGSDQLYEMNADGSGLVQLTQSYDGTHGYPAFSPDGNHIAYTRLYNGISDVWMMNADGTGAQRETFDGQVRWAGRPAWSSDGQRIAYGDSMPGHPEVFYTWAFSVQSPVQVTSRGYGDDQPTWAPNGTSMIFTAYTGTGQTGGELLAINLSSGTVTTVANSNSFDGQANWGFPTPGYQTTAYPTSQMMAR